MWTNVQIVPKANDENSTRPNILIQGPYRHLGALSILALPSSIFNVSSIGELAKKESDKIASNPGVKLIEPLNMNTYTIDGEKAATLTYTSSIDFRDVAEQGISTIHNGKVYTFLYIIYPPSNFNSTEQKIREHIFKSIRWIPSLSSSRQTLNASTLRSSVEGANNNTAAPSIKPANNNNTVTKLSQPYTILAKDATRGINASAKLNKSKFTVTSLDMLGAPWDKIAVNPTTNTIYVTNATTDYSHNSTVVVIDGNTNKMMANNLKCSTKDKGVNKQMSGYYLHE
ncbi:MAG: hypothetical protein WBE61_07165 [Nitrososphaeraceae archaeon]